MADGVYRDQSDQACSQLGNQTKVTGVELRIPTPVTFGSGFWNVEFITWLEGPQDLIFSNSHETATSWNATLVMRFY